MFRMNQPKYRVYCHDGFRKIVSAEWVDAPSDEEAIAAVQASYDGFHCEIWDSNRRLVAEIAAASISA